MSQTGKLMPNLDQQSTKMLNLTVLQRMDPFIEEILITAAHVTFYAFNVETNQWEYSTAVSVYCNEPAKHRAENLVENLLGDFEYEVQSPYLLYRNQSQEVNGIWFYNRRECEDVANLFTRILSAYSKVPAKPKVASGKSEYEELEAVPNMSVFEGPLEPSSTASAANDNTEDSSFENFFSTAMNIGSTTSSVVNSKQLYQPSPTIPLSSHTPSVVMPSPLVPQIPSLPLSSLPTSNTIHGTSDPISSGSHVTNLVKPSSFFAPPSSSSVLMPPPISPPLTSSPALQPPLNLQRPYGTPMLQPFPPPTPPPSLTPSSPATPPLISRDKVRDALLLLVQDDQFIDMFHQALLKVHHQ
ncbi:hypothetical protein DKX38_010285 [Salix brachista]|uniref:mRNA-decapping enzyme C-terminal domain-containing protein n=1 Tax=Salix brachista TaxID=2182728 RepID=A0A5N5MCQ6_9ROSI|nr:hypothetical protein DKX38_010285 [Salix brachista]